MKANPVIYGIRTDVLRKFIRDITLPKRLLEAWGVELVDSSGTRVGHVNFQAPSIAAANDIVDEARRWLRQNPATKL